jgi:cleavage and polyadenylation specificity factor subunit 3
MEIMPLGAGQEVGRSCILCKFKGKSELLDCGLHPGKKFEGALPFFDEVDLETVDVCLITHFHIDHVGALPYLTEQTTFQGRVFMTHPTKAISPMVLGDYVKQSTTKETMLFDEKDVDRCFAKVEVTDYHVNREVNGIKFWSYNAGHVLGAAMFMIEIAGVRVLYTGDFSRWDDRHLVGAETPSISPDILLCESTFGAQEHLPVAMREKKFLEVVTQTIKNKGRVLLPVFALGRAQEMLLILDEHWDNHPELQSVPIFYGSKIASRSMDVYKRYVNMMNESIQKKMEERHPFDFKHVEMMKSVREYDDHGPCVIMCSPGTMQSGMSRELFDMWCDDPKCSVIIPGYMVKGTFSESVGSTYSKGEMIQTLSGDSKPFNIRVEVISFSAHSDYRQSSDLITSINPPNIVLVHGESKMMRDLKSRLKTDKMIADERIRTPANCETVQFQFHGHKMVKVVGKLADQELKAGQSLQGMLVRKDFDLHVVAPDDLPAYSTMKTSKVSHRQVLPYSGSFARLEMELGKAYERDEVAPDQSASSFTVMGAVGVSMVGEGRLALEWEASPVCDAIADHIVATVADIELTPGPPPPMETETEAQVEALARKVKLSLLREQFGTVELEEDSKVFTITNSQGGQAVTAVVDDDEHGDKGVKCTDERFADRVKYALRRIENALYPMPDYFEGDEYSEQGDAA